MNTAGVFKNYQLPESKLPETDEQEKLPDENKVSECTAVAALKKIIERLHAR